MNIFYEEEGSFKVAMIKEEKTGSLMVEDTRGKRSKIKSAHVLLYFDHREPESFLRDAYAAAESIDPDFLWACCGPDEFSFETVAAEYFSASPTPLEQATSLIRLHTAPMYFYRKGKGRYRAAPENNLKAAKASIERKRKEAEQIAAWESELISGRLPEDFISLTPTLLYRPDKQSIHWKALVASADHLRITPLRLMHQVGAIPDIADYFLAHFLADYFPGGRDFGQDRFFPIQSNTPFSTGLTDLPLANVAAFSIDDATTTEIDDALSLTPLPNGHWQVGIHIAAPTLGIAPDSVLDGFVMNRLSTVYMPGDKITMLPESVLSLFTLAAGQSCPAVSMYLEVNPGFDIVGRRSCIERVPILANLRHDAIEPYFNDSTVNDPSYPDYPWKKELIWLWHFAQALEARRGKQEANGAEKVDYTLRVHQENGTQRVEIISRKRGSPMDKLVAELMILVNTQWGKDLADAHIAGIYRAKKVGRVYMTTEPSPHHGLGVECYGWFSSPLRRAVDFTNQQQLLGLLTGHSPRFERNDPELFSIINRFDSTYSAYAEFQEKMERYWCLRYLEQENRQEYLATILKENKVQLHGMPLVTRVNDLPEAPAGTMVKLQIKAIDYLELKLECMIARL